MDIGYVRMFWIERCRDPYRKRPEVPHWMDAPEASGAEGKCAPIFQHEPISPIFRNSHPPSVQLDRPLSRMSALGRKRTLALPMRRVRPSVRYRPGAAVVLVLRVDHIVYSHLPALAMQKNTQCPSSSRWLHAVKPRCL